MLLCITFVIILILLVCFLGHVFSEDPGLIDSLGLERGRVKHELSHRCLLRISLVQLYQVLLQLWISLPCSINEPGHDSALSPGIQVLIVIALPVLVLEYLLLDDVIDAFVGLVQETGLNEVILLELELALIRDGLLVIELLHE